MCMKLTLFKSYHYWFRLIWFISVEVEYMVFIKCRSEYRKDYCYVNTLHLQTNAMNVQWVFRHYCSQGLNSFLWIGTSLQFF